MSEDTPTLEKYLTQSLTKQEDIDESKIAKENLKNQRFKTRIESERQQQKLKGDYANWAKWVVSVWLLFIALLISLVGFNVISYSDSVLITLLATTTLNVTALSAIIIKGLFAKN